MSLLEFEHVYGDVNKFAVKCFNHDCRMGESVQIDPSCPRATARQHHRANNPASSPLHYYHWNLVIPLLDEVFSEFDARFSKPSTAAGQQVGLVPYVICEREVSLEDTSELYANDLPSPELLDQKPDQWKRKFMAAAPESRPRSCASAIKMCDPMTYPNICIQNCLHSACD